MRLLVLMTFICCLPCEAQIKVINTGSSDRLLSIQIRAGSILVAGESAFLGKCKGDCDSLVMIALPPFANLNYYFHVDRPDTNVLYITASCFQTLNLQIWKSVDGGNYWVKRFDTTSTNMFRGSSCFFDSISGITITPNFVTVNTTNGFSTYTFGSWPDTSPRAAKSYGDSTVAVLSFGAFSISNDRGKTWPKGYGTGFCDPTDLIFITKDTLAAVTDITQGVELFSTSFDGGNNWSDITFKWDGAMQPDIQFQSLCSHKGSIYITGRETVNNGNGAILKTPDYGKTWFRYVTPFKSYLRNMKFIDDSTALVCGDSGLLFRWYPQRTIFTSVKTVTSGLPSIKVIPNPTKGQININGSANILGIVVSDISGRIISQGVERDVDLSQMSDGLYFITVYTIYGVEKFKVVKHSLP